jgi:hypothetical protein
VLDISIIKIVKSIPTLGHPIEMREKYIEGKWYPINKNNIKSIDLFVFYFDSQNPFSRKADPLELDKIILGEKENKIIMINMVI